jgi:hypothetical protein
MHTRTIFFERRSATGVYHQVRISINNGLTIQIHPLKFKPVIFGGW